MNFGLGLGLATVRNGGSPLQRVLALFGVGDTGAVFVPGIGSLTAAAGLIDEAGAGDPVGFHLDLSQGAGFAGGRITGLGSELVSNGTFDTDATGWSDPISGTIEAVGGDGVVTFSSASVVGARQTVSGLATGRFYELKSIIRTGANTNSADLRLLQQGGGILSLHRVTVSTNTETKTVFVADGTSQRVDLLISGQSGYPAVAYFDNISVREIPGYHATQPTVAARPSYIVDADGTFIQHDLVDDALTVTLPDMGTEATVAYVTRSEVRLLEDQTISGSYTLPTQEIAGFVAIDRALTIAEKVSLIRYLASKVEGVNYGAEIDRLTLIAINAVDVFVYDTSKDSDGGAWRHRCTGTSWYTETLNTATRGSRREFPSVAVIVAEADNVTIYDGDDPSLPMWAIWNFNYTSTNAGFGFNTSIAMLNGLLVFGRTQSGNFTGIVEIDLVADVGRSRRWSNYNNQQLLAPTARSLTPEWYVGSLPGLASALVNDVAMTVLPDAPIDPATGLPVPTIAVATAGGVSVIKDDGTVVDSAKTTAATDATIDGERLRIAFTDSDVLAYDIASIAADGFTGDIYDPATTPALMGATTTLAKAASCSTTGMTLLAEDEATPENGMVAYTTSAYNTGWMNGDIKGAFLSDTDDSDLVGGTDADRSVNGNDLTVNGTITRSPVADGAELVGYSGFSAANYLEGTDASYVDTLYAIGWEQTSGVWEFKHGVVSAAPIDGLTITTNTLKIEGTKPKALIRLSATTPSVSQLEKIEADEQFLFQENAQATLYGTSDAVTALAHDPDTDLLHVGTSAGRSVFEGLRRVGNTTTSVSTAISASGGLVLEK